MIPELALVVQLSVGLIFLASSLSKVVQSAAFFAGLADYGLTRARAAVSAGIALVAAEGFVAATHLTGWALPGGLMAGISLVLVFGLTVSMLVARKRNVPCLCFGAGGDYVSGHTLGRLGLLLAAEIYLVVAWHAASSWIVLRALQPEAIFSALLCAVTALAAISWLIDLPRIVRPPRRLPAKASASAASA